MALLASAVQRDHERPGGGMSILERVLGNDWITDLFNPNHEPGGSPIGGQFARAADTGAGMGGGATEKPSMMPTKDDLIPDALYASVPQAVWENVYAGTQKVRWRSASWLDSVIADNPYDAMQSFAARQGRRAERVLGNTPINRFIFNFENGVKTYEVRSVAPGATKEWYIETAAGVGGYSRGRGKSKVPFWSDYTYSRGP